MSICYQYYFGYKSDFENKVQKSLQVGKYTESNNLGKERWEVKNLVDMQAK